MEYERIGKVQSGIISPTKLRMKLIGTHYHGRKDSPSSRTSPSKLQDSEFAKNSLLSSTTGDFDDEACEGGEGDRCELSRICKMDNGGLSLSTACATRNVEYESSVDCDSTASSSSFEFQKEKSMAKTVPRPTTSSKWNDAEKWIVNRHAVSHGEAHNKLGSVKIAPESFAVTKISETRRVDSCQSETLPRVEKFSFVPPAMQQFLCPADPATPDTGVRSVAMRDTGTEMTPAVSQEPSRTATPVGATTPLRSPSSSIPCSPRRGSDAEFHGDLSEKEVKEKTRKEIVALGVQLGKMNIAAWANKQQKNPPSPGNTAMDETTRTENGRRAAVWEEAERSKDLARFKREEIQIEVWESEEKAKLEAEMRRIEAKVEQMKAQAHAKMAKKIAAARQKSEKKRAAAEARRNRLAEETVEKAAYIRRTGKIPSSSNFICCGWL